MRIPQETIELIRERVSLVDVASEHVSLKRSGRSFVGLCPFHQEKTPSFNINDEEGFFCCFGCGKKGSVFDFIMETRGYSFVEAVKLLAGRAGVDLPREWEPGGKAASKGARRSSTAAARKQESASPMREHGSSSGSSSSGSSSSGSSSRGSSKTAPSKADSSKTESPETEQSSLPPGLLRAVMAQACEIYHEHLLSAPEAAQAREYLIGRGLDTALMKAFKLGYAPDAWEFIAKECRKRSTLEPPVLERALRTVGLTRMREPATSRRASAYDVFRNRALFPITRSDGAPTALGGRLLAPADGAVSASSKSQKHAPGPKYLNSCESPIYSKRRAFYGLSQAAAQIRRQRHAVLVEGYLDVISLYRQGVANCIAGCGTALGPEQVQILSRLADRVTLLFDGDAAGFKAGAGCFELFMNSGLEAAAVLLPEGEDPDSIAQKRSPAELLRMLEEQRVDLIVLYVNQLRKELALQDGAASGGEAAIVGKLAAKLAAALARIKNPVERELRTRAGADLLGVSVSSLQSLLEDERRRLHGRERHRSAAAASAPRGSRVAPLRGGALERSEAPIFADEAEPSSSSGGLDPYVRQLLVALLCEPGLAKTVIDLPSMFGSDGVFANLQAEIRSFIAALGAATPLGVGCPGWDEHDSPLVALMNEHGLQNKGLLEEALRQSKIGGARHKDLVAQADEVTARVSLRDQIERIRSAEAGESDAEHRERLAQEKLMMKRSLHRLGKGANPSTAS